MAGQLALYEKGTSRVPAVARQVPGEAAAPRPVLCAACRAREARYGFRDEGDGNPAVDRPRTLCFDCFRVEVNRRQAIAARLARGWNGTQTSLPLEKTLDALRRRRGRAQIAARKALELR